MAAKAANNSPHYNGANYLGHDTSSLLGWASAITRALHLGGCSWWHCKRDGALRMLADLPPVQYPAHQGARGTLDQWLVTKKDLAKVDVADDLGSARRLGRCEASKTDLYTL